MKGAPSSAPCRRPAAPLLPTAAGRATATSRSSNRVRKIQISCSSCRRSEELVNPLRWPVLEAVRHGVAGAAICFSLITSSLGSPPAVMADAVLDSSVPQQCAEQEPRERLFEERSSTEVTNEEIVEEAWEVVNDSFLDAENRGWSPEKWMKRRNDVLSSPIPSRSRAHDTIRNMLTSLGDSYTRFLTTTEFSKMARYDLTGIGINLREIPDASGVIRVKVLGIVLDGPAYLSGIRQGDAILSVNGEDVNGKSAFEVSSLLQETSGTFVTLKVQHGDCGEAHLFRVKRQSVAQTPVFYRLERIESEDKNIGYVQLKEFNALAKKDLVIAMKRLEEAGVSCLVLDLRDNRGGLVQAGIEIAKLFLDKGQTVIYTVGRDPEVQRAFVAEEAPVFTLPLIVLVNGQTASASEIVAAALHDNCRAVLVGDQTYGKGLIQSVYELHDGSGIVVTIGKYVSPKHMDINGNGIRPDFSRIPALSKVTQLISKCSLASKA
ncbi:peptidase S41 family protein isoform X2 [Wolffia australiana]